MQEAEKVHYSETAATSPAFSLIVEGFNWLVQEGLRPDYGDLGVSWDDRVLFVASGPEILACLVYSEDVKTRSFVVNLMFVEPSSRKKGHATRMMAHLETLAMSRNIARILLKVYSNNEAALDVVEKMDFEQTALYYEKVVS